MAQPVRQAFCYNYLRQLIYPYPAARAQPAAGLPALVLAYRLGLHAGALGRFNYYDAGNSALKNTHYAPEAMLRLGWPRIANAQADASYGAKNAFGAYTSRLALGSGLGRATGRQLLAGYAYSSHYPTPNLAFVSARLTLPPGSGLGGLSLEPYFATDFDCHQLFSLKLHYQLGTK